jgi:poly(3-hydroxybutyrate) depolymerase
MKHYSLNIKQMKKTILFLLLAAVGNSGIVAQNCNSKRFTEVNVFGRDSLTFETRSYGAARNVSGQLQSLNYNVWYPKLALDPLAKRPFILMVHGGGFVGGQRQDLDTLCLMFARRGFVAATIDYRLKYDSRCRDTLSKVFAVYRAVQDAHAAMRFFVANANRLRIDTAKLLVGGSSAGAATVLGLTYTSQQEIDQLYPRVKDSLGRLDTSGNAFRVPFRIKGLFNNWGGLQKDYFDAADAVPMISFHGDADTTVDIDSAADVQCLTASPTVWGSRTLHNQVVAAGKCSNITVTIGGVHGIFNSSNAEKEFRISKAACFFKSLFCGGCTTVYTTDTIPANCAPQAARPPVPLVSTTLQLQRNPVSDVVAVNALLANSTTTLQVYDLAGRPLSTNKGSNSIRVQNLPAGTYLLQVNHSGTTQQLRFVKQ